MQENPFKKCRHENGAHLSSASMCQIKLEHLDGNHSNVPANNMLH